MRKFYICLAVIVSFFLSSCVTTEYSFKYEEEQKVNVGDAMVSIYNGNRNLGGKKMDGTTQELIYSGISNGVLNIAYKEYQTISNHTYIRDSFTQNLQYDINKDKIITYKDLYIEIIEANSNHITYKVLRTPKNSQAALKESKK